MDTGTSVDIQPGDGGNDQGQILQDPGNIEATSGQANGSEATGDELFGPSSLPPELEETRRQLVNGFHRKLAEERAQIAEERGRMEAESEPLRQKSDILD